MSKEILTGHKEGGDSMKITTLRVPDALHKHIRRKALDENVSMNTCILQAIRNENGNH